jgi:integrase
LRTASSATSNGSPVRSARAFAWRARTSSAISAAKNLTARSFKPLLKRSGLPNIRLHDLRHTCATLMLCEGVHIKLVQELLGHATVSITLDTYSHLLPGMGDETACAMDRIFN